METIEDFDLDDYQTQLFTATTNRDWKEARRLLGDVAPRQAAHAVCTLVLYEAHLCKNDRVAITNVRNFVKQFAAGMQD